MFGFHSFDGNSRFERDPELLKLEYNVFKSLSNIVEEVEPNSKQYSPQGVRFVSFEEALKELLEIDKKN